MNKIQFRAMALDLKDNPQKLAEYRKQYKYVYPFSDGIFKILMANEAKPERYGTTEGGAPVLIEVQQNFNTLFVDRLVFCLWK